MAPRDTSTHTTPEDEVRALITPPVTEEILDQLQDAGEEFEVVPAEGNEPMDEDNREEVPEVGNGEDPGESEEDPEEDPEEDLEWELGESDPEEEPDLELEEEGPHSPVHTPVVTPNPYLPTQEPLGVPTAAYPLVGDPYLAPPPVSHHPMYRWTWIRRMVSLWRREEGTSSTAMAPSCPITNEPTHLTIPLLISRLFRHENRIQELHDAQSAMPSHDLILQLQREVRSLRNDHREMRDAQVYLEGMIANGLTRIGAEVEDIREMLAEMNVRSREQRGPGSRNEGH